MGEPTVSAACVEAANRWLPGTRLTVFVLTAVTALGLAGCGEGDTSGVAAAPSAGGGEQRELIVFHAGSLSVPFRRLSELFEQQHPNVTVKAEAAGSRDTARKVSDLNRPCDVLGSADYKVIENLLMPEHAGFCVRFATNEMGIAYTDESKLAGEVNGKNWGDLLMRDGVAFGRADPNSDPCGYRTVMVFQLAEKHFGTPGLADKLAAKDGRRYMRPKETDLLALLEAGEIDYLFIYRSVAKQHGLKFIAMPDEMNLKSGAHAELYSAAVVELTGKKPGETITRKGAPIVYGVTIPKNAPNPELGLEFVRFLLSSEGQAILEAQGQPPMSPPIATGSELPPELGALVAQRK